jgi:hypothetical protein
MEIVKHIPPTKAICNKGFSGNSFDLPRSNFGVGGQESSPKSLTVYSLNRWLSVGKKKIPLRFLRIFTK